MFQVEELQRQAPRNQAEDGSSVKLQQLHSAWESRHATAEKLSSEESKLAAQANAAVGEVQGLLTDSPLLLTAAADTTRPMHDMRSAVSQMTSKLYTMAGAADQLSGHDSQATRLTGAGRSWGATVFAVDTMHTLLDNCFHPELDLTDASSDEAVTSDSQSNPTYDQAAQLLHTAIQQMNQKELLPCLVAQLQKTAEEVGKPEATQTDPMNDDLEQRMLEDLSHLELDFDPRQTSDDLRSAAVGSDAFLQQQSTPQLKPFNDFDTTLPGADDSLEPLGSSIGQHPPAPVGTSDLIAFTDFDASLQGADQLLELDAASPHSSTAEDQSQPLENGSVTNALDMSVGASLENGSDAASDATDVQHLSQAMLQFLQCAGAVAAAELQEQSLTTAQAGLQLLLAQDRQKNIVCFGWIHEPALHEALQSEGGLEQPAVISPHVSSSHTPPCWA